MRHYVFVVAILLAASPLAAQDSLQAARKALEAGELAQAVPLFEAAQTEAQAAGNSAGQADASFYLGLTLQRQAEAGAPGPETSAVLRRAIEAYRKSLEQRPGSAATANNLSRALRAAGQREEALSVLQAAAAKGTAPAYVLMNLGDQLAESGRWKEGAEACEAALRAEPHNDAAEEWLFKMRGTHDPDALPAHLWNLVALKRVSRAQDRAMELLRVRWGSAGQREELLAVVAVTLSQQFYAPKSWLDGPVAKGLRELGNDPGIGSGARELILLHEGTLKPDAYTWWATHGDAGHEAPRGVWPFDAFRMLIRSQARWNRSAGQTKVAESLYLLSTHLSQREPDPTALLEMADLFAAGDRLQELGRVMEKEEPGLFAAKGMAYRTSQMANVYRYHRALGVIYSYLKRWTGGPASAEFQLQHAVEVARDYNARPGVREPIRVEPRLHRLLATTYENSARPERAAQVRLAAAEEYLKGNDVAAAVEVLGPVGAAPDKLLGPRDRMAWTMVNDRLNQAVRTDVGRPGLAGFMVQDLALKGVVKSRDGYIAMVVGADGKSYFVKPGYKLFDGVISSIDDGGLTLRQEVRDPLSPVRVRDVRLVMKHGTEP